MSTAKSNPRRSGLAGSFCRALLPLAAVGLLVSAGCCATCKGPGPCKPDNVRTQVQFFAPPGATVTVCDPCYPCPPSKQVGTYSTITGRLEQNPEEFAVFDLAPGHYEFKYTSAEGLPGVSIYGEIEIEHANSKEAQIFQRRAFIPIALPSEYYRRVEVNGNEILPYRGEPFRTAIDANDMMRLKEGDVVEKVFVVADLEDAEKRLDRTQIELAKLEREIEYADARFRYAYLDFRMDADDAAANFWGTDREFIEWEAKRQRLEQKLAYTRAKVDRTRALLKADTVLTREGMLVLATEEVVKTHRDVENASERIGEVLAVMRIGGRHMHWGDYGREKVEYQP